MLCAWSVAAGAGEVSRCADGGEKVWCDIWVGEGPQKRKKAQLELKEVDGRSQRCMMPMGKEKEGSCGRWKLHYLFFVVNELQHPLMLILGTY